MPACARCGAGGGLPQLLATSAFGPPQPRNHGHTSKHGKIGSFAPILLKKSDDTDGGAASLDPGLTLGGAAAAAQAGAGAGTGISFAIFRRFWAVATRWNSSRAPLGPSSRSRWSFRIRLRCANSISIV
jgi:hypothetical protein